MAISKQSLKLGCVIVNILLLLLGCSHSGIKENVTPTQTDFSKKSIHADGSIISLTSIQVPNTNGLYTYKMMYWSDNVQTEAFVAAPQGSATCPLFVICHGGHGTAANITHEWNQEDQSALENANPRMITLVPEYRGYNGSDGTIQGLSGNALDTNNAIKAVMSKFAVAANHIYLEGVSIGGGVVLKLASERNDIRSVIAISPFVGWDICGLWATQNKDSSHLGWQWYSDMMSTYGTHDPNSPLIQNDSVDFKKIEAPVLLLQGTGDQNVPWQTVQTFYNDLKHYNQRVRLILYPYGEHGLHDKYLNQVKKDISDWYQLYGENGTA